MSAPVEPRLRGHHFICLQFFRGEGYSLRFIDNLALVIATAETHPATVVDAADDVCAACPGLSADGTCLDPKAGELEVRRMDRLAFGLLGVAPGARMSLAEARARLSADAVAVGRWRFGACGGCTWEDICEAGWDALLDEAEPGATSPE